jgi:phenylpyruvate tautomerase PptA (4-oxalocrotonate tautomerase family)
MPFVRITASSTVEAGALPAVSEAVHRALVETIDVPEADRFQVVDHAAGGSMHWNRTYLGVQRSGRQLFVEITLARGRDDDRKRALYAAIVRNVEAEAGIRPAEVLIVLTETGRVDWSFGDGIAQYAP